MVGYVVVAGQCVITHQQFPFSHSLFSFSSCFTVTLNTFFLFLFLVLFYFFLLVSDHGATGIARRRAMAHRRA